MKVAKFGALVLAGLLFVGVGCFGLAKRSNRINSDFQYNMDRAEMSSDDSERLAYYQRAIAIKPGDVRPYLQIVETLKKDEQFTVEEQELLTSLVAPNRDALRKDPDYAKLAFQIGKLYWHYWTYGSENGDDNTLTRRYVAMEWFSEAEKLGNPDDENTRRAKVYKVISQFTTTIDMKVREGEDNGVYREYWEALRDIVRGIQEDDPEIVVMEIYSQVLDAVIGRAKGFRKDGVSYEGLKNLIDSVTTGLDRYDSISQSASEMKEAAMAKVDKAIATLNRDYDRGEDAE